MRCEDRHKRERDGGLGRGISNGIVGAKVRNMSNVRGKTGNFSWLSLAVSGLGSGWRVWQQSPLMLAQLQKDTLGNTANLAGEGDKLEPVVMAGGSVTVPRCCIFPWYGWKFGLCCPSSCLVGVEAPLVTWWPLWSPRLSLRPPPLMHC